MAPGRAISLTLSHLTAPKLCLTRDFTVALDGVGLAQVSAASLCAVEAQRGRGPTRAAALGAPSVLTSLLGPARTRLPAAAPWCWQRSEHLREVTGRDPPLPAASGRRRVMPSR